VAELTVRAARHGDLDALLSLYGELAGSREAAAPAGRSESEAVVGRILADDSRHLVVASIDGEVVGSADMLLVPNLTHHGKPWAIVENVIVAPGRRRTGVGRRVMEHLLGVAAAAGCYKVQLLSDERRTEAHGFYRSLGFREAAKGFKRYLEE
jgi:GNAT superfamily N-acetyltransferase